MGSRIGKTIGVITFVSAIIFVPIRAGETCAGLRPERQVSFKQQEPKLFQAIEARFASSSAGAPEARSVLETFEACLDELQRRASVEKDDDPGPSVSVRIFADGRRIEVKGDGVPTKTYRVRDKLGPLAQKLTRDLLEAVDLDVRPGVRNRLWFVWIESYLIASGSKYNHYRYADEVVEDEAGSRGRSFAVGFEIASDDGTPRVAAIHDERLSASGLVVGDALIGFDGRPLDEMTLPEVQSYWLSREPFSFLLAVRRGPELLQVAGESVSKRHASVSRSSRGALGYLRIREFSRGTTIELRRALRAMERAKVEGLVVDLRGNPGGSFSPGLVDIFFKPGETVASFREIEAEEAVDLDATVEYWPTPVALLIDGDTASMAEALTAAFATHERGPIIGETTTGKGVGQSVYPVLDEGRLSIVERVYYYPGTRDTWSQSGIPPTVPIEIDEQERGELRPYLAAPVVQLEAQWERDAALRLAEEQLLEAR